jgi:hypothetical protein
MANTIIYKICEKLGYNEEALKILRGLLSDGQMPTLVMEGNLFRAPGFQPSGKYGTAEDNSLRGLILLVYAWVQKMTIHGKHMPENVVTYYTPKDFFLNIRPKTYGDDMLGAIKEKIISYFNNRTYPKFVKNVYGMEFTASDKSDNIKPYLKFDETSFLKRKFVYNEEVGHYVAQLDRDSIMKSFCYMIPSKNVGEAEQVLDSTISALRELFLYTRSADYDKLREQFAQAVADNYDFKSEDILKLYPRYEDIKESMYPHDCEYVSSLKK